MAVSNIYVSVSFSLHYVILVTIYAWDTFLWVWNTLDPSQLPLEMVFSVKYSFAGLCFFHCCMYENMVVTIWWSIRIIMRKVVNVSHLLSFYMQIWIYAIGVWYIGIGCRTVIGVWTWNYMCGRVILTMQPHTSNSYLQQFEITIALLMACGVLNCYSLIGT